jgi:quercetin dioxygenase-like cupin family protein
MTYTPSPRPTYDGPTHISYDSVRRHLWGDPTAGEVADWIYISNDKIHQIVFGLPSGGWFRHSEQHRTIFAADIVYYVLSGTLMMTNPETGEVHQVHPGEAAFFRRDTWHHAFSVGEAPLRVLEYFSPPPSQGTSGAYARTRPLLTEIRYTQEQWIGRWPMAQQEARQSHTIRIVREHDALWRMAGRERPVPVALLCSTEHLTVGKVRLLPGQHTDVETHAGDECLYLVEGTVNVRAPEAQGVRWFELKPGDSCYLPQGEPHQYYNISSAPATFVFGCAPGYLAEQKG